MAFSRDGARIATAGRDHSARVWDANTGAPLGTLDTVAGWASAVAFSPTVNGSRRPGADHAARLWSGGDYAAGPVLTGHVNGLLDLRFSPDGARLLTASSDRTGASGTSPQGTFGGARRAPRQRGVRGLLDDGQRAHGE